MTSFVFGGRERATYGPDVVEASRRYQQEADRADQEADRADQETARAEREAARAEAALRRVAELETRLRNAEGD